MKRWSQLRVSGLWLAAAPPIALWLLEPVRAGSVLSALSGQTRSDGELLALSLYLGAYLFSWLLTPVILLSFVLQRGLGRVLARRGFGSTRLD